MFELVVLGSGTAIPHKKRGASGYACIANGVGLLLECGPGSTRRWPAAGLTFESVRGIVVTHHHVDHCSDLGAVLFGRNVPEPPVSTPLLLAGPVGHGRLIESLTEAYGDPVRDAGGGRALVELSDRDSIAVEPFTVSSRLMHHSDGALGVRVSCGDRVLAFSGDSGPCDALVELLTGCDLALLECSYPASRATTKHLNSKTAAEVAAQAGVSRLVLTHFYPECDEVDIVAEVRAAGYEGELHLAADGDRFSV